MTVIVPTGEIGPVGTICHFTAARHEVSVRRIILTRLVVSVFRQALPAASDTIKEPRAYPIGAVDRRVPRDAVHPLSEKNRRRSIG
jgi:hypothetical protein